MSAVLVMPLLGADSSQLRLMGALMRKARAAGTWPPPGTAQPPDPTQPTFTAIAEDHYRYTLPQLGIVLDFDRARREHYELCGELTVRVEPRPETHGRGIETTADFSVLSGRSREEWIRRLSTRCARINKFLGEHVIDIDWYSVMEALSKHLRIADRDSGEPVIVDLRTVSPATADRIADLQGLHVPLDHPSVLFADGGEGKTLYAVYLLGLLVRRGIRCGIVDWEMDGAVHSARLGLLFPTNTPLISYLRCTKPLVDEADRIHRFLREHRIAFTLYDSIAKACDGPPEAAEVAGRYQRVVRRIGGGSLHIAHITKKGEDQKPFGSGFWANDARATWFMKSLPDLLDETVLHTIIYNRKATQGALAQPIGFAISFGKDSIDFTPEVVDDGKVRKPTVRGKMTALLRRGSLSADAIAGKIGASAETVKRTARRYDKVFKVGEDGTIGLDPSTSWMVDTV
jgi:hypothetical protein